MSGGNELVSGGNELVRYGYVRKHKDYCLVVTT